MLKNTFHVPIDVFSVNIYFNSIFQVLSLGFFFTFSKQVWPREDWEKSRRDGREWLKFYPFSPAPQKCLRENNSFELKITRGRNKTVLDQLSDAASKAV